MKWGILATLAVLGSKSKALLVVLKLFKLPALLSLLATTATYTYIFGFPYAVGIVGQILLHESGHALAMHKYNIPFSPMVFIPFFGAFVSMKEMPISADQMAYISLAGPVFGTAASLLTTLLAITYDSQLLFSVAQFGYMVNLFNMLPIGDLDGGRVASVLSKWFLLGGFGMGCYMISAGMVSNPLFYLIMVFGAFSTFSRFFGSPNLPYNIHSIPRSVKTKIFLAYISTIGVLLFGMQFNRKLLQSPAQLRGEKKRVYGEDEDPWDTYDTYQEKRGEENEFDRWRSI